MGAGALGLTGSNTCTVVTTVASNTLVISNASVLGGGRAVLSWTDEPPVDWWPLPAMALIVLAAGSTAPATQPSLLPPAILAMPIEALLEGEWALHAVWLPIDLASSTMPTRPLSRRTRALAVRAVPSGQPGSGEPGY